MFLALYEGNYRAYFKEVIYESTYSDLPWAHFVTSQLGFRLRFENWFFYFYGNSSDNRFSYIGSFITFIIKFSNSLYKCFTESIKVCSSLCRILSVNKWEICFGLRFVRVGNSNFNIIVFQVNDWVKDFTINLILKEIFKTVFWNKYLSVEYNFQSRIQVRVVLSIFSMYSFLKR